MIAAGDVAAARAGADELDQTAELLDAPYLRALATSATGSVLLAEGDPTSALPMLRTAESAWRELDAPYETARVQVLIGLACAAVDDPETSTLSSTERGRSSSGCALNQTSCSSIPHAPRRMRQASVV